MRATHIGSKTAIVEIVKAAKLAKVPVRKLAVRIQRFFIQVVSNSSLNSFQISFIVFYCSVFCLEFK